MVMNFLLEKKRQIKNYIFQGGSVKGIAYIGALAIIEKEKGVKLESIEKIGGTSVGAITASLLSVGYDLSQLNKEMCNTNFEEFIDINNSEVKAYSLKLLGDYKTLFGQLLKKILDLKEPGIDLVKEGFQFKNSNMISQTWEFIKYPFSCGFFNRAGKFLNSFSEAEKAEIENLLKVIQYAYRNKGLADGEKIRQWLEERIQAATGKEFCTFAELAELHQKDNKKYKLLYLMGTNVTTKESDIFSHEETPNAIISDAVRISMSIPILFKPHKCYEKTKGTRKESKDRKSYYVDGGVMDNYPVWLFDYGKPKKTAERESGFNSNTLGFRLEPLGMIVSKETDSIVKNYLENVNNDKEMEEKEYIFSIVKCFLNKQESDFNLHEKGRMRTISIEDRNVSMLDFSLKNDDKAELIISGQNAVRKYNVPVYKVDTTHLKFLGGGFMIGVVVVGVPMLCLNFLNK